jgi:uncharacterized protein YyaL (SSP411 family)
MTTIARFVIGILSAACVRGAFGAAAPAIKEAPAHTNRLAKEKSPYLLQHAHNPVDWYPWGAEAFEKAKKENKPIFLSVGYSTCHWCHVMERESFSDEAVAKLVNENFVPVKVDREERPDVDRIYMAFLQATTGGGGWPMNVMLTPDLKPFFGGTYFPPEDKDGLPGLKKVLARVHEVWETRHDEVVKSAESITESIGKIAAGKGDDAADGKSPSGKSPDGNGPDGKAAGAPAVDEVLLMRGADRLAASFDARFAGFGAAPKFPEPANLDFLFRYAHRTGDAKAQEMALRTLSAIARGGVRDELGGGFHRYSTDRRWFLPHFEKMLYDQAQLAGRYLDAYQFTQDEFFGDVARDTLDYVLRDMTGPDGQFYSAEDADSARDPSRPHEKAEGAFYVWRAEEIQKVLGPEAAEVFSFHFDVAPAGNVPEGQDPRKEFPGQNVLYAAHSVGETATKFAKPIEQMGSLLDESRKKLLDARSARPRPHRDDKTIVAWNGLMISTLARAGPTLKEPRYTAAAARAATFVREKLYDPQTHTLSRIWRESTGGVPGFLDDYAFFTQASLDVYEATLDVQWLRLALDLQHRQDALFEDKEAGGYFSTSGADKSVLLRVKDDQDGAEPAGNSVAAFNLLRLAQMTGDAEMGKKARKVFTAYAARLNDSPTAFPQMLAAVDFSLSKPRQIILAGDPAAKDTAAMLAEVYAHYLPNRIVLAADGREGQAFLTGRLEVLKEIKPVDGRATAYVCENYACQQPTNDVAVLRKQLAR